MVLKILLVISIILQLAAAVIATRLTRVTKYNLSWILITIALTIMTLQRVAEFAEIMGLNFKLAQNVYVWTGVVTSVCFAAGIFLIRKIISYITMMEEKRRLYEKRILDAIIQTEERERQRFSKEIHDGLGPLLSSAKMSVSVLAKMNTDPARKEIIDNMNTVVEESVKAIKEISNNLNPHMLMNFGLVSAVNNFIKKLLRPAEVRMDFTSNLRDKRFGFDTEVILYRVICEMINNTMKHAEATAIKLDINFKNDEITITFEDDGKGFDMEKLAETPGKGMGLSNITSRINSLKGEVGIRTAPGEGTAINIRVKV